jgi:hypothetical protein
MVSVTSLLDAMPPVGEDGYRLVETLLRMFPGTCVGGGSLVDTGGAYVGAALCVLAALAAGFKVEGTCGHVTEADEGALADDGGMMPVLGDDVGASTELYNMGFSYSRMIH